ncbi:MAG: hypothetical protein JO242_11630 [Streptosporangiaceae bacterium]|nr:hypothetical protein [Streptosporangiaceae bacterium]
MSQDLDHEVNVGVLEHESFDTGSFGAFCNTSVMWIGPHRDSEEEAEEDSRRHRQAVKEQYRHATQHQAVVRFDQDESDLVDDMVKDNPEYAPVFGSYFPYCGDCNGYVGLGCTTEEEAADDASKHRSAFTALIATR